MLIAAVGGQEGGGDLRIRDARWRIANMAPPSPMKISDATSGRAATARPQASPHGATAAPQVHRR